ncbi:MAG: TetR/AcrR family transcriptional regulator [Blautia sp.]|nr:TetR/AcrR family transcriptional regulator [Blautia sp.]MDY5031020.1 TetR/AcrR family transcriptional regulator [Blautia sp.]
MKKIEQNKIKKKEALYNTAFSLFTTKGTTKTTISDIVEKAGVAKGTFYLYFKDKYDIHNKLVIHKTTEMFYRAHEALLKTELNSFEEEFFFIIDSILEELEQNHPLLTLIYKDLSWGVFESVCQKLPDEDYEFYQSYLELLAKYNRNFTNPKLMLYTIIELVGSTCYSCILFQQPASLSEYKPYLYRAINGILNEFSADICE